MTFAVMVSYFTKSINSTFPEINLISEGMDNKVFEKLDLNANESLCTLLHDSLSSNEPQSHFNRCDLNTCNQNNLCIGDHLSVTYMELKATGNV